MSGMLERAVPEQIPSEEEACGAPGRILMSGFTERGLVFFGTGPHLCRWKKPSGGYKLSKLHEMCKKQVRDYTWALDQELVLRHGYTERKTVHEILAGPDNLAEMLDPNSTKDQWLMEAWKVLQAQGPQEVQML